MTTSPSPAAVSHSPSNGESLASLPRWRQFLSMLNWRRDPGYDQSIVLHEQRRIQHEQRMKQLESDILRVRSDRELIESEILQIEKETEQLRQETARLRQLNAREKALSALIRQHCFPPECSSIPPQATESDCESSWS
ncbi:hypothetical protein NZK33_09670 [Cyanobium sp. FGCU-6]|nr:hypothetical protein [Cyanobium sp. FGCU6]